MGDSFWEQGEVEYNICLPASCGAPVAKHKIPGTYLSGSPGPHTQLSGGLGGARLRPAQLLTALLGGNGRGTSLGLGESFKNNCNNSQPVPTTVTLY